MYDNDEESIKLLDNKYASNENLHLFHESFEDIESLPKSDMIIAWRSLPFMPHNKFYTFWQKIIKS